ncbi:MAG: barstar family protein [Myxococcota bacterium]
MTTTLEDILLPGDPALAFATAPWTPDAPPGVRMVRLAPAQWADLRQLHAALARGLELPDYYGHNWDALLDMLTDGDALGPEATAVVIVVDDGQRAIAQAGPTFGALAEVVQAAERSWRERERELAVRLVVVWSASAPAGVVSADAHAVPRAPDPDAFAADWIAGWNSHDLEHILAHYADDAVFTSPIAAAIVPGSHGTVRGKAALRSYWTAGLARNPTLHFELVAALPTAGGVTVRYQNHRGQEVAETMLFDAHGLVRRGIAAYGPVPDRQEP